MSTGRSPAISDRSATRADLLDDRTAENVAPASTSVPPAVASDEMVTQSAKRSSLAPTRGRIPALLYAAVPRMGDLWVHVGAVEICDSRGPSVAAPRLADPRRGRQSGLRAAPPRGLHRDARGGRARRLRDHRPQRPQLPDRAVLGDAAERRQDLRDDRPSQPDDGLGADQDRRRPRRPGEASRDPRGEGVRRARRDPRLRRSGGHRDDRHRSADRKRDPDGRCLRRPRGRPEPRPARLRVHRPGGAPDRQVRLRGDV